MGGSLDFVQIVTADTLSFDSPRTGGAISVLTRARNDPGRRRLFASLLYGIIFLRIFCWSNYYVFSARTLLWQKLSFFDIKRARHMRNKDANIPSVLSYSDSARVVTEDRAVIVAKFSD